MQQLLPRVAHACRVNLNYAQTSCRGVTPWFTEKKLLPSSLLAGRKLHAYPGAVPHRPADVRNRRRSARASRRSLALSWADDGDDLRPAPRQDSDIHAAFEEPLKKPAGEWRRLVIHFTSRLFLHPFDEKFIEDALERVEIEI